jgi:hypothetical protein
MSNVTKGVNIKIQPEYLSMAGKTKKTKPRKGTKKPKRTSSPSAHADDLLISQVIDDTGGTSNLEDLAKGIFMGAESAIAEARELNCDVTEAELFLEKGRKQFQTGNFDYADNYCQLAINAATEASKKRKAEVLFHEVANIIKDNAALYSNIQNIETIYRKAEEFFDQGDYDEAIKSLDNIKNDAVDIIYDNIIIETESKLQKLAEKLRKYRNKDVDIEKPMDMLTIANEAFDGGDYLSANELVDEALQILNSLVDPELRDRAIEILAKMNKLRKAQNLDNDALNDAEPFFKELKEAFKAGQFELIVERETELDGIAEKIIKIGKLTEIQALQENIKLQEIKMREMENHGINIKEINDALVDAKSALKMKDYDDCKNMLQKAQHLNEELKSDVAEKKVQSIIFSAQSLINEISETGADVQDAETRLTRAKKLLTEKKYEESQKIAEQTIMVARENLLGHLGKRAEAMIDNSQKLLKELKTRNISSSDLESIYDKAEDKFRNSDYTGAIEMLKSVETSTMKLLNQDISNQVMGNLKQFEEKIKQAREYDIPVDNFVKTLEEVKKKLEVENYPDAEKVISKSLFELNGKLMDLSLRKKMNEVLGDIETIRNLGGGVKRLEALRDLGNGALKRGNLIRAEDTINKLYVATKKSLNETYALQTGKQLRILENKLKAIKEQKIPVPEIDIIYNDAVEALRNRDYETALKLVNDGNDLIDGLLQEDQSLKLMQELDGLIPKIEEVKISGMDVERLEKAVSDAKQKIDDGDFSIARDMIRKIDKDFLQLRESKKVNDLLKDIETEMREIKLMGVNVNKLEVAYDNALKAMKRNDLRRAIEIGRDINSILTMIKKDQMRSQANEIFEKAEEAIKSMRAQKLEIKGSEELYLRAKEALTRNEFEECINLSRQVEDLVKQKEKTHLIHSLQRKLDVFKFELEQAKSQGMDITQYEKSLKDIKSLLNEGKPNPAQDVLILTQRTFKKALNTQQAQKEPKPPAEVQRPPEIVESPESAGEIEESEGIVPRIIEEKQPGPEISEDDKSKFKSLGNVGLKTLEKMSAKADSFVDFQDEDGTSGLIDNSMELPIPVPKSPSSPQPESPKGSDSIESKTAIEKKEEISREWVMDKYKQGKKELEKIKIEEKAGLKIETPKLENKMNAVELSIKENNLRTAKTFLDESHKLINNDFKPKRLQFSLRRLKSEIEDLWSAGTRIETAEIKLRKAKKAIDSSSYDEADEELEKLNDVVEKFKIEKQKKEVNEKLKVAEKNLKALSKLDIEAKEVKVINDLLLNTHEILKDNRINEAMDEVKKIISQIDGLEITYWNNKIDFERDELEGLIKSLSDKNNDALKSLGEIPQEILDESKRLQEARSFHKALKTLIEGKKRLDIHLKQIKDKRVATGKAIPETKDMIKTKLAFEKMLSKPMPQAREEKAEAKKMPPGEIKKPSKVEAPEIIKQSKVTDMDKEDPESYSRGLITDIVLLLQKVRSEDNNVEEPTKLLQNAKEEFICKNYKHANELALNARDILMQIKPDLFQDQAEKDVEDLYKYFETLKEIGVQTKPLEKNMETIEKSLKNQEFTKVRDSCSSLKNKAQRLKVEFLKATLQPNLQNLLAEVQKKKDAGIEVAEIESYLADAENSISDNDYDGACQLFNKALELYQTIPDELETQKTELNTILETLRDSVKQSKNYKIDNKQVTKLLNSAETDLSENQFEDAEEKLKDAEKKLNEHLKEHTEKMLSRVELAIDDVSLSGADTSSSMELLEVGKKALSDNEYHDAIKTLLSAERMAIEAGDSFVKIFEGLRRLSREMSQVPKDNENYDELLKLRTETKQKMESKDYSSALESLNSAVSLLNGDDKSSKQDKGKKSGKGKKK